MSRAGEETARRRGASAGSAGLVFDLRKPQRRGLGDFIAVALAASYAVSLLAGIAGSYLGWAGLGLGGLYALLADFGASRAQVPTEPCAVMVGAGRMAIDGVELPTQAIAHVTMTARAEQTVLDLDLGWKQQRICCRSPEEAESLLRALGIDSRSDKVRLAMPSRAATISPAWSDTPRLGLFAVLLAVAGLLLARGLGPSVPPVVALGLALPGLARALAMLKPMQVWVGADAIEAVWLGKHQYVRYADIVAVRLLDDPGPEAERRVALVLATGRTVVFAPRAASEREALLAGFHAFRKRTRKDHGGVLEAVRRRGRSYEAWLRGLRGLGNGAGAGARSAAIAPEALEDLATDPDAEIEHRVAAAIVLREAGELEAVERVRVASASSDTPRVRVALDRLHSDADESALLEALSEAGDAEALPRAAAQAS